MKAGVEDEVLGGPCFAQGGEIVPHLRGGQAPLWRGFSLAVDDRSVSNARALYWVFPSSGCARGFWKGRNFTW
jgi:hypothetical protein